MRNEGEEPDSLLIAEAMKTNQWLAYLLDENRADLVGVAAKGWPIPAAAVAAWVTALRDDLEAEAETPDQQRTLDQLVALAGIAAAPPAALLPFWDRAEARLNGYIAAEPDLAAGAKRLAYLRLSTFGHAVRTYLRET
jgi:hypothetical protein